jgi:hypothetical protein
VNFAPKPGTVLILVLPGVDKWCRNRDTPTKSQQDEVACISVERGGIRPRGPLHRADLRDLPFALLAEREQVAVDEVGMRGS